MLTALLSAAGAMSVFVAWLKKSVRLYVASAAVWVGGGQYARGMCVRAGGTVVLVFRLHFVRIGHVLTTGIVRRSPSPAVGHVHTVTGEHGYRPSTARVHPAQASFKSSYTSHARQIRVGYRWAGRGMGATYTSMRNVEPLLLPIVFVGDPVARASIRHATATHGKVRAHLKCAHTPHTLNVF
jgi:hypothetical protein